MSDLHANRGQSSPFSCFYVALSKLCRVANGSYLFLGLFQCRSQCNLVHASLICFFSIDYFTVEEQAQWFGNKLFFVPSCFDIRHFKFAFEENAISSLSLAYLNSSSSNWFYMIGRYTVISYYRIHFNSVDR